MSAFVWFGGASPDLESGATANVAATIGDEWTASAAVTESVPLTTAASIGDEWTAAATVAETIPLNVASAIGDEWTAAAQAATFAGIAATVAADIGDEWTAGASLTSFINITATVAANITDDFNAAVTLSNAGPVSVAVDSAIGDEWTAAALMQAGALFTVPGLGNPRAGAHPGAVRPWPTKDPDSFLPYWFNWSNWTAIEQCGNIAFYEVAVDSGDGALVLSDMAQGTGPYINWVQVWIRGGTEGTDYVVRCSVTLDDGRTEDASRSLTIASH